MLMFGTEAQSQNKNAPAKSAMRITPPMTPPTIGPTLLLDPELAAAVRGKSVPEAPGVVVVVAVVCVVDAGNGVLVS